MTGAASGIGKACALAWMEVGANIVLTDINGSAVNELSEALGEKTQAHALDTTSPADWERVIEAALKRWSRIDGVANVAGTGGDNDTIEACSESVWRKTLRVNLDGTFLGTKYGVQAMKDTGGGAIINVASVYGYVADPKGRWVAYSTSKGGVRMLSKSAAVHCAEQNYNIRINTILPGFIDTPMASEVFALEFDAAAERQLTIARHPIGRLGLPEEIAKAGTYLLSEEAAFVTGAEFVIDGGYSAV